MVGIASPFRATAAVEDVESCTGSSGGRHMAPGSIPHKCRQAMSRLDACIEAHQQEDPPS